MIHQQFKISEAHYTKGMFFVALASRRKLFGYPHRCKNAGETPALRKTRAAALRIWSRLERFHSLFAI
jgi:hypothetical protein